MILSDEVGLGKTIEAGLLLAQRWAERRAAGRPISQFDCQIAAIAIARACDAAVATLNTNDYEGCGIA